jgi:nucleoside-diphosphate-sugar epimerase
MLTADPVRVGIREDLPKDCEWHMARYENMLPPDRQCTCPYPLSVFAWTMGRAVFLQKRISMTLHGKVALITGGNSGIGLATARRFIAEGVKVAITGRNASTLAQARSELGEHLSTYELDVSDATAIEPVVNQVAKDFRCNRHCVRERRCGRYDAIGRDDASRVPDLGRHEPDQCFLHCAGVYSAPQDGRVGDPERVGACRARSAGLVCLCGKQGCCSFTHPCHGGGIGPEGYSGESGDARCDSHTHLGCRCNVTGRNACARSKTHAEDSFEQHVAA